jgi:ABC-2 type transport system permease protein
MSATEITAGVPAAPRASRDPAVRLTFPRIMRSEWIKLYSLRSTRWSLLVTLVLTIGLGGLAALARESHPRGVLDPLSTSLTGVQFAILSVGVLGVLLISGEYSTGMIRSTMSAVPKRLPVLWSKLGVYATVELLILLPAVFAAFFVGQAILSGKHLNIALSTPGVPRAVVGAALFLTLGGLFAMALGAILRNAAGAISAYVAIMFVIPSLLGLLPSSISNAISPYLPAKAGEAIMDITHKANTLSPWAGLAVLAAWTAALIAIAAVQLRRRDV